MQSGVTQAVANLIKSGNANTIGPVYTIPGFQADDIYPIFKKHLNAQTQQAMDVKADQLVHQRQRLVANTGFVILLKKLGLDSCKYWSDGALYVREFDLVHFCASRAGDKASIQSAVTKVVKTLNDLGQRGYITASMLPLSVMALAMNDKIESEYVVLSYVALTKAGGDYAKQHWPKMFVQEGTIPERFEDQ